MENKSTLAKVLVCKTDGKLLPEPIMTQLYNAVWRQYTTLGWEENPLKIPWCGENLVTQYSMFSIHIKVTIYYVCVGLLTIYDIAHKEMGCNICGSINDINCIRQHVLSRLRLDFCKLQFNASM